MYTCSLPPTIGSAMVYRRLGGLRETAASPDWGDRLDPHVIAAIQQKKLLPVAELDRGFVHPTYPTQVVVSYFQAGRICGFIAREWGYQKLLAMMHDFSTNTTTPQVIEKELGMSPRSSTRNSLLPSTRRRTPW